MISHYDAILRAGMILRDPQAFVQGHYAVDGHGRPMNPNSRRAARWSAYGIMYHVFDCKMDDENLGRRALDRAAQCESSFDLGASTLFKATIVHVNDVLGHEAVLQCMRFAARRMREIKAEGDDRI